MKALKLKDRYVLVASVFGLGYRVINVGLNEVLPLFGQASKVG